MFIYIYVCVCVCVCQWRPWPAWSMRPRATATNINIFPAPFKPSQSETAEPTRSKDCTACTRFVCICIHTNTLKHLNTYTSMLLISVMCVVLSAAPPCRPFPPELRHVLDPMPNTLDMQKPHDTMSHGNRSAWTHKKYKPTVRGNRSAPQCQQFPRHLLHTGVLDVDTMYQCFLHTRRQW